MKIKSLLKIFVVWQIILFLVVLISVKTLPIRPGIGFLGGGLAAYQKNPLLNYRSNFDGINYVLIATNGYQYGQQAFFPLYPQLIRFFLKFSGQPILIGWLLSSVSFFLALYYFIRLIRLDYPKAAACWTLAGLLLFPTSFFFSAVYTEGLFFLLMILAFYSARKGNWLLAGLFGLAGAYTRLIGIFLFPALLIEFWQSHTKPSLKLLPIFLIPLGTIAYMYYLYRTTGDPFAFYHVQVLSGHSLTAKVILPYQILWRYLKMIATVSREDFIYPVLWLEFVVGSSFILISIWSFLRQRLSYAVFSATVFLLPTFTGNFVSLPRYALMCFPLFIGIGNYLYRHPKARIPYFSVSAFSLIIYLSLFARGYWVS